MYTKDRNLYGMDNPIYTGGQFYIVFVHISMYRHSKKD